MDRLRPHWGAWSCHSMSFSRHKAIHLYLACSVYFIACCFLFSLKHWVMPHGFDVTQREMQHSYLCCCRLLVPSSAHMRIFIPFGRMDDCSPANHEEVEAVFLNHSCLLKVDQTYVYTAQYYDSVSLTQDCIVLWWSAWPRILIALFKIWILGSWKVWRQSSSHSLIETKSNVSKALGSRLAILCICLRSICN